MNKTLFTSKIIFIVIFLTFFSSCTGGRKDTLDKKTLFSISIGKTENDLDYFREEGIPFQQKINLYMKEGLFYISNGKAGKIMKFNSYGDILFLLYNEKKNPTPILLSTTVNEDDRISNRVAYAYPFVDIGEIAVVENKILLIDDAVEEERQEYDEEIEAMLCRIVLRFDTRGKLVDYIGQEGLGGTPFPYIEKLQVTTGGEIVVMTRTMKSWLIFWYSRNGKLLYRVNILYNALPVPEGVSAIPSLETIHADRVQRKLYLKLDYYTNTSGERADPELNAEYSMSGVYVLDLKDGNYKDFIQIPRNIKKASNLQFLETETREYLYEFLGVTSGGYLFFLSPEESNREQLLILNRQGKVVQRTYILPSDRELVYSDFYLNPSGVLSALLCDENRVEVAWWRTDKIIESVVDENS